LVGPAAFFLPALLVVPPLRPYQPTGPTPPRTPNGIAI
jgi:hypothetical protein